MAFPVERDPIDFDFGHFGTGFFRAHNEMIDFFAAHTELPDDITRATRRIVREVYIACVIDRERVHAITRFDGDFPIGLSGFGELLHPSFVPDIQLAFRANRQQIT